jgi:predicted MFS family arabinose efflux permease
MVQVQARPEMHGRVLSLQTVVFGGGSFVGGPLLGLVADTLGGRAPIVLGGVVCLLAGGFGYAASRRYVHGAGRSGG